MFKKLKLGKNLRFFRGTNFTGFFFMPPPPDIAKVLVSCAAAALVPAQGLSLVPAEATCVLYKLSVVTCAVVPLQIICAVQSGVFECCATDHVYRQKRLPTKSCAAVLVHCADKVLVPYAVQRHKPSAQGAGQENLPTWEYSLCLVALCRWGGIKKYPGISLIKISPQFQNQYYPCPYVSFMYVSRTVFLCDCFEL